MSTHEPITVEVRMEETSQVETHEDFHSSDDCEYVIREFFALCGFPIHPYVEPNTVPACPRT